MGTENLIFAFSLTLFAGLATGIGSLLALFTKRTNTKFLSVALGFSAGVMIYVSMVEIFPKAQESLISEMGKSAGSWATVVAFFGGMLLIAIIDNFIPSIDNPHEIRKVEELEITTDGDAVSENVEDNNESIKNKNLMRMGIFTAIAVAVHNFPEGLATFIAALQDPSLGVPIAVAIAIHNIPEGIAVSIPIYYATGSRKKAFIYSFLSGLAEPVGAGIGFLILMPFLSETLFGILFASVAGIMVFISLDQLLPAAREYGEHHLSIYGLVGGMMVMALSLLMFI
ncbi:MAG: zinc transporter ZupT [Alkaliphilus sp.]|nr:zinc transporter ZupT [bacterium AH-315-E09]PHS35469.1 MAG: zinc transporter ZupT [Alkaliphilus sp.]